MDVANVSEGIIRAKEELAEASDMKSLTSAILGLEVCSEACSGVLRLEVCSRVFGLEVCPGVLRCVLGLEVCSWVC